MSDNSASRIYPIRPSPLDDRDFLFENMRSARAISVRSTRRQVSKSQARDLVPETLDLRKYLNYPRNQGSRGTCGAFAAAAIKEYQERLDVGYQNYMSPESIYFYRENKELEGMYGRNVMKILNEHGVAPEPYFPYGSENPEQIPEEAKNSMGDYKIQQYARVDTIDGAKKALYLSGPLLICLPVYEGAAPEFWKPKNPGDKQIGGHALAIVGYDQKGFIMRNSWGLTWNFDGHIRFPYSDFGMQWEIWSSIDEESPKLPPYLDPDNDDYRPPKKLFCCI